MIPAGDIPEEFHRIVYSELTAEDIAICQASMKVSEGGGKIRSLTEQEIREQVPCRIIGVLDIRDGTYYPQ